MYENPKRVHDYDLICVSGKEVLDAVKQVVLKDDKCMCIYASDDYKDGLYIGKSNDFHRRYKEHKRDGHLEHERFLVFTDHGWQDPATVSKDEMHCWTKGQAAWLESYFFWCLNLKYNGVNEGTPGTPGSKYVEIDFPGEQYPRLYKTDPPKIKTEQPTFIPPQTIAAPTTIEDEWSAYDSPTSAESEWSAYAPRLG